MRNKTSLGNGKRIFFAFLCCSFLSGAMAQTANDTAVRQKIRLLTQQMENAFNSNDMGNVAAFYADDAEIVYDNGYTVKGRTGLNNYWASLKDKGRGWKLTVVEVGGGGDLVFQLGRSDLKYVRGSREENSITNFVLLWKVQPDGSYRIFRDYLTQTGFEKKQEQKQH